MFPFKQKDSEVELSSCLQISKRQFSARKEISFQENYQDETILKVLNDAQNYQCKENLNIDVDKSQNPMIKSEQKSSPIQHEQLQKSQKLGILNTSINIEELGQKQVQPARLMKVLKLLVSIQHFFRILSLNSRIFNKLTKNQHDLISDISSAYSKNISQQNGGKMFNFFKIPQYLVFQLANKLSKQIFTPSSNSIKTWDSLQSLLVIFSTFLLNLELFFQMDISNYQILFQVIFIIFHVDILVELNTGVLKKGNIITDRSFIFKLYLKEKLLYNFIANIPLLFYIQKVEVTNSLRLIINILYTFKWFKISNVLKQLAFYVSYEKDHKNIFDLLKLLTFVVGICHFFCLFWHGLVMYEVQNGITNNWLASKNLLDASISERYIYSFYFLAVTMATVGYGDITPQNKLEVFFTTITIFVTCIVYAFSLNTIGGIIENIEKKDKKYKENLQVIHGLMREEEVSRNLKIKISDYIEYLYKESNEIQRNQQKLIIDKLSAKLRNDLILEIQGKYLSNIPLFKLIKEKDKIAKIMEEQLYSPAETIFKQGDIDDCSLFYIVKGSVSIIFEPDQNSNRESQQIQLKQMKEYFGEISFITGNPRTFTAKATDFCRIYKINREDFLSIVKENNQDFENYQMIQQQLSVRKSSLSKMEEEKNIFLEIKPYLSKKALVKFILTFFNIKIKRLLQYAVVQINNLESVSENVGFMENGSFYQEYMEKSANFNQELQLEARQRNNTNSSNQNNSKNEYFESLLDSFRIPKKSVESYKEKTIDSLRRLSKTHQSQQSNLQQNTDQINQVQKQARKSFLYQASQNQFQIQELQKSKQYEKSQISLNEEYQKSQTQSSQSSLSSEENKISSRNSIQINKNYLEDIQNQQIFELKNAKKFQQRNSLVSYKRHSNILNANNILSKSQINILLNNDMSDQQQQKDYQNNINNNQTINDRTLNLLALGNPKEPNLISNNTQKMIDGHISKFNICQTNTESSTIKQLQQKSLNYSLQQFQQLSPKNNQNQISQQNIQKILQGNNQSRSSSQFSKLNTIGAIQISDNKFQEAQEFSNQVNYLMLQNFDKAKIFKYYWPNFNYIEIVQKWIQNLTIKKSENINGQTYNRVVMLSNAVRYERQFKNDLINSNGTYKINKLECIQEDYYQWVSDQIDGQGMYEWKN
ncbi:hypothetical protein ABPG72_009351 [Tetrahymena utriculariae]